jgi:hypothetical protein
MDHWTQTMNSRARYRASMSDDFVPSLGSQYLTATTYANWDFDMRLGLGVLAAICSFVLVLLCFLNINRAGLGRQHTFHLVAMYTSLLLFATLLPLRCCSSYHPIQGYFSRARPNSGTHC